MATLTSPCRAEPVTLHLTPVFSFIVSVGEGVGRRVSCVLVPDHLLLTVDSNLVILSVSYSVFLKLASTQPEQNCHLNNKLQLLTN